VLDEVRLARRLAAAEVAGLQDPRRSGARGRRRKQEGVLGAAAAVGSPDWAVET